MTPTQARMARAALKLSLRDLGAIMDLSATILSRYEQGGYGLSSETVDRLEAYYREQQVFCGPGPSVCVGQDALGQERFLVIALVQLLQDAGIEPTSRELHHAYERAPGVGKPPEPQRRRREQWYMPNGALHHTHELLVTYGVAGSFRLHREIRHAPTDPDHSEPTTQSED